MARQALFDHAGVLEVVMGEETEAEQQGKKAGTQ
jgi:hypothetical protein